MRFAATEPLWSAWPGLASVDVWAWVAVLAGYEIVAMLMM